MKRAAVNTKLLRQKQIMSTFVKLLFVFGFTYLQLCCNPVEAWGKVDMLQDDFQIDFKDPAFVDINAEVKDGLLYVSYDIKKQAPRDMEVKVEVYNHNGKKYIPVTVPGLEPVQNFCHFMETETMFVPDVMEKFIPKPPSCPWPVGVWNLTGYKTDTAKLPPMMPTGKYRTKLTYIYKKKEYYAHSWFGRIVKA